MLLFLLACSADPTPPRTAPLTPLRLGWQTTWATQGQVTAILDHEQLLTEAGFSTTLVPFAYGGPLNEGALAGAVDVLFTADQPALILHAKDPSWDVAGRLMYNRVGTLVPAEGGAAALEALRGKTLAVPFGAAAQREAYRALQGVGLDPARDLSVKNLGIEEILSLTAAGASGGRWGEVDAVAVWDPAFAQLEAGGARPVADGTAVGLVLVSTAWREANPGAEGRFLTALAAAWRVWRADPVGPNAWFEALAKADYPDGVLNRAAAVEPNLSPTEPIRTTLSDDDVRRLEQVADFMSAAGLLKSPVDVRGALLPGATAEPR